ncbi:hypothetical protein [Micromonospora sp. NPDC023737]|uniref:hypothetical protein n=1 Tax=unclassified Micromonospora TaxID=2617518 RepID=UPI0033DEA84C
MVEALCALIGCLLLPYLLATWVTGAEFLRDMSRPSRAAARRQPRAPGLFAALVRRHRRAMFVVRELERRDKEPDEEQ